MDESGRLHCNNRSPWRSRIATGSRKQLRRILGFEMRGHQKLAIPRCALLDTLGIDIDTRSEEQRNYNDFY